MVQMIQLPLLDDIPPIFSDVGKRQNIKSFDFSKRQLVGKFLMLGAGRQSSAIAEMIVKGDLPKIDMAIFADTGDEPSWVYEQVWYLTGRLSSIGIPLVIVNNDIQGVIAKAKSGKKFPTMPMYVGTKGNQTGIMRRQCTNEWKIQPSNGYIRQWLLEHGYAFQLSNGTRVVKKSVYVEMWFGFGKDEKYRQKRVSPAWQKEMYPLNEKQMDTSDCITYLTNNGLRVPGKSACRICPFHDDRYWLNLKTNYPIDFLHACDFDNWIRSPEAKLSKSFGHIRKECYLHVSCLPLSEIDFVDRINKARQKKISDLQLHLFNEELEYNKCGTDGAFSCFS